MRRSGAGSVLPSGVGGSLVEQWVGGGDPVSWRRIEFRGDMELEMELWGTEREMGEVQGWCVPRPRASVLPVSEDPWRGGKLLCCRGLQKGGFQRPMVRDTRVKPITATRPYRSHPGF